MRIVSLCPATTEIVSRLGLDSDLVGVTHECDYPDRKSGKVCVTRRLVPDEFEQLATNARIWAEVADEFSLYQLDAEALVELEPDIVIAESIGDITSVSDFKLKSTLKKIDPAPRSIEFPPKRFDDVLAAIEKIAISCGVEAQGRSLTLELRQRVQQIRGDASGWGAKDMSTAPDTRGSWQVGVGRGDAAMSESLRWIKPGRDRPHVVVLAALKPLVSAGRWSPDVVALAGGGQPLVKPGEPFRAIRPEAVAQTDPDVLVFAPPGDVDEVLPAIQSLLEGEPWSSLRAVGEGRAFALDGALLCRPGPRLVDGVEVLAHALAPTEHALPAGVARAWRVGE